MILDLEKFTPAEAAGPCGISTGNQRSLRRVGHLPKEGGHARFDLLTLSRLAVFGALSERGVGPKRTAEFADVVGQGIFLRALSNRLAYAPEVGPAALGAVADPMEFFEGGADEGDLHKSAAMLNLSRVARAQFGLPIADSPEIFVLWANGHPEFFYGDDHPFSDVDYTAEAFQGAAMIFIMGAMAHRLLQRLPRRPIRLVSA